MLLCHKRQLCAGKNGGLFVGKTKRGKGTKIIAIAVNDGFHVFAYIESALLHEFKLVEATINSDFTEYAPDSFVFDKAYDNAIAMNLIKSILNIAESM